MRGLLQQDRKEMKEVLSGRKEAGVQSSVPAGSTADIPWEVWTRSPHAGGRPHWIDGMAANIVLHPMTISTLGT